MAITYVAGGTQVNSTNNGGNVSLTLPTLLQNDVVVVFGGHEPRAGVAAIPSGYTSIYDSGNGAATPHFAVSYKVMGSTPDTTVTCPGSGNSADATAYACWCLRGVDTGNVVDQTATNAGPTTSTGPDSPSITTVTNGAEVLTMFLAIVNDSSVTGPGGSYTNNSRAANFNDTNPATVGGYTANKATAGAENPPAFSGLTSSVWRAVTAAIRPSTTATKTGTDTLAPKIDEAKTLLGTSTRADTAAPKITDTAALIAMQTVTETVSPLLTETFTTVAEGWDFQVRGVNAEGDGNWSNTATAWLPISTSEIIVAPSITWISDSDDATPEFAVTCGTPPEIGDVFRFRVSVFSDMSSPTLYDTDPLASVTPPTYTNPITTLGDDNYYVDCIHIRSGASPPSNVEAIIIDAVTEPMIVTLSPLDNAVGAAVGPSVIVFSEAISAGSSASFRLYDASDDTLVEEFDETDFGGAMVISSATLTISWTLMTGDASYYILWDAGSVVDGSSNPVASLESKTDWNFTTSASYVGPGDLAPAGDSDNFWFGLRAFDNAYALSEGPLVDIKDSGGGNLETINCLSTGAIDASAVATWIGINGTPHIVKFYDQTGNGHHSTIGSSVANAATLEAAPSGTSADYGCLFNANSWYIHSTNTHVQAFTIASVYKAGGSGNAVLLGDGAQRFGWNNGVTTGPFCHVGFSTTGVNSSVIWMTVMGIADGASGGIAVNGTLSSMSMGSDSIGGAIVIGGQDGSPSSPWTSGRMLEIGVIDDAFSGGEITAVDANMQAFWGI